MLCFFHIDRGRFLVLTLYLVYFEVYWYLLSIWAVQTRKKNARHMRFPVVYTPIFSVVQRQEMAFGRIFSRLSYFISRFVRQSFPRGTDRDADYLDPASVVMICCAEYF